MGRTKRKRNKNRSEATNPSLSNDQATINLRKWLKHSNVVDPLELQLRHFTGTGRGVTSKKSVKPMEVLMRIPFELLITFDTVRKSDMVHYLNEQKPLTIQTLLALFLVMEKHKGDKSEWKSYIESLPHPEPSLPWMCPLGAIKLYPEDLRISAFKLQGTFEESLANLKKAVVTEAVCKCCGKPLDFLLDPTLFKWAYVLVNTRAVYIDPDYLMSKDKSKVCLLADDPFLALCPFLDLINHHHIARTKATVMTVGGETFYELTTMTGFKKYKEFFISYGSHSNEKLLMEYGFFIPGNTFDSIKISFKEILDILKLSLDERQYKCIKNYEFHADELYINQNGVSFVLKAILFVGYYPKILNYGSFIFSNRYPNEFDSIIVKSTKVLLNYKLEVYIGDATKGVDKIRTNSNCGSLMVEFLEYRVKYVQKLLEMLDDNKLCF